MSSVVVHYCNKEQILHVFNLHTYTGIFM